MTDRDRLIELIRTVDNMRLMRKGFGECADYLLANDVTKVVRCKDCKHWGGITYGFICRKFSGIDTKICMGADQYCSYGELKELGK